MVLVHSASAAQPPLSTAHSSISAHGVATPPPEKPAPEAWTSDAVLDAAWSAEFKRAERVASREKEKERARHLRDWAQLAVRRDEQRSWGKVLSESTERIEPAGVLTYSLKEVFELPAD